MECDKEISITDKIVEFIKIKIPGRVFNFDDFRLCKEDNGTIKIYQWNFDFEKPTFEELEKITVIKKCPKTCVGCLIKRIEKLESV